VRKVNADVNRVLADPEVLAQMRTFGFDASPQTPEQLGDEIRADAKKYGELVRRTGATAD
jgi:tripartite-type tricarboxylate transporter receptor subunit TctC